MRNVASSPTHQVLHQGIHGCKSTGNKLWRLQQTWTQRLSSSLIHNQRQQRSLVMYQHNVIKTICSLNARSISRVEISGSTYPFLLLPLWMPGTCILVVLGKTILKKRRQFIVCDKKTMTRFNLACGSSQWIPS